MRFRIQLGVGVNSKQIVFQNLLTPQLSNTAAAINSIGIYWWLKSDWTSSSESARDQI